MPPLYQLVLYIIVGIFLLAYVYNKYKYSHKYLSPSSPDKTLTWIVNMYPPYNNAGAEWMIHCLNRYLVKEYNYTINVFMPSKNFLTIKYFDPTIVFEGVHVYDLENEELLYKSIASSKALCSHLVFSLSVKNYAEKHKKPYIHFLHNNFETKRIAKWSKETPIYLVANSQWIADTYKSTGFPTTVLYPPVSWREYETKTPLAERKWVTLINVNKNKGGELLPEIAAKLPEVQFAGVRGGYDKQIIVSAPNITYLPNTPHIQDIYAQTKILLVPSKYESWGRVAVEAMSSGIPVIANPTPGLKEALGNAGIFCYREDVSAWVREIKKLTEDASYYQSVSERCRARARELDPVPQMDQFAMWLSKI